MYSFILHKSLNYRWILQLSLTGIILPFYTQNYPSLFNPSLRRLEMGNQSRGEWEVTEAQKTPLVKKAIPRAKQGNHHQHYLSVMTSLSLSRALAIIYRSLIIFCINLTRSWYSDIWSNTVDVPVKVSFRQDKYLNQ